MGLIRFLLTALGTRALQQQQRQEEDREEEESTSLGGGGGRVGREGGRREMEKQPLGAGHRSRSGRRPPRVSCSPPPTVTGPAAPRPEAPGTQPAPGEHGFLGTISAPAATGPRTPALPSSSPLLPGAPTSDCRQLARAALPWSPGSSPTRPLALPPAPRRARVPWSRLRPDVWSRSPPRRGQDAAVAEPPEGPVLDAAAAPPLPDPARHPQILTGYFEAASTTDLAAGRGRRGVRAGARQAGQRRAGGVHKDMAGRRARSTVASVLASGGGPSDSGWRGRGQAIALTSPHSPVPGPATPECTHSAPGQSFALSAAARAPPLILYPIPRPLPIHSRGGARAPFASHSSGRCNQSSPSHPFLRPSQAGSAPARPPNAIGQVPPARVLTVGVGPEWVRPHPSGSRVTSDKTSWYLCGRD